MIRWRSTFRIGVRISGMGRVEVKSDRNLINNRKFHRLKLSNFFFVGIWDTDSRPTQGPIQDSFC